MKKPLDTRNRGSRIFRRFFFVFILIFLPCVVIEAKAKSNTLISSSTVFLDSLSNDNASGQSYAIRLRLGYKFSEDAFPATKTGWGIGIAIRIPVSKTLQLYPEFNYWTAKRDEDVFSEDVVMKEYAISISQTFLQKPFVVNCALGLGFGTSTRTPTKNQNLKSPEDHGLIAFNLEGSLTVPLTTSIRISLFLRHQRAGSLSHGGDAYVPFFLGLGGESNF